MGKFIDITGQKFGKLTVIKKSEKNKRGYWVWLCRCDCGREIKATAGNLKSGNVKSSGCSLVIDLIGKEFGRLRVIKRVERPKSIKGTGAYWQCVCKCGRITVVSSRNLITGTCKSCGCLKIETIKKMASTRNRIEKGKSAFNILYHNYKKDAKKRKLEFNIDKEFFKEITQKNCFYCGSIPERISKPNSDNGNYIYNGIDRVNNDKGYIVNNVVPCCWGCNQLKGIMNIEDFISLIEKIHNFYIKGHGDV